MQFIQLYYYVFKPILISPQGEVRNVKEALALRANLPLT